MKIYTQSAMILLSTFALSSCFSKQPEPAPLPEVKPEVQMVIKEPVRTAPGVVEYVWEEPMVDVIDVPPGLDPEGTYWRPGHQSIVEIRQGKWKYYKKKRRDQ